MRLSADRGAEDGAVVAPVDVDRIESAMIALRSLLNGSQLGNNINQIAHALNVDAASGLAPHAASYEAALMSAAADIADLKAQIAEALGFIRGLRPSWAYGWKARRTRDHSRHGLF